MMIIRYNPCTYRNKKIFLYIHLFLYLLSFSSNSRLLPEMRLLTLLPLVRSGCSWATTPGKLMAALVLRSGLPAGTRSIQMWTQPRALPNLLHPASPVSSARLLDTTHTMPALGQQIMTYKVRTALKKRCPSCYFVNRHGRLHVECKAKPRHKQMAQVSKRKLDSMREN